jgi:transcriptional regulator with XRE-family HTH domain
MDNEWRFDVIVNPGLLIAHMDFAGYTVRKLAAKVGCSHSTIGHYRTGARRTCAPDRAKAIAKALNAPLKPLFLPTVSRVAQDTTAA